MSKIPEGATHTAPDGTYRMARGSLWYSYADGDWVYIEGAAPHYYTKIQDDPEWSGEGIPPSGTTCEMRRADYVNVGWQQIEFLFAGSKKAFFRDAEGHEWSRPLSDLKFRSIRTPEQIAAEEREKAVNEMVASLGRFNSIYEACGMLYDENYRKQVAK